MPYPGRRGGPYSWKATEANCGVVLVLLGLVLIGYGLAWLLGWG